MRVGHVLPAHWLVSGFLGADWLGRVTWHGYHVLAECKVYIVPARRDIINLEIAGVILHGPSRGVWSHVTAAKSRDQGKSRDTSSHVSR